MFGHPAFSSGRKGKIPGPREPHRVERMSGGKCATCGGPLEAGFVATTNGSGLFWSHQATSTRFRPKGLEVLIGTGFGGTFSANLPGQRCAHCRTILLALPEGKTS